MRINFFGGPGAGKSTTTARVFSQLKESGVSVEHVGEYVKSWAYQKRSINTWDQVYIFGKQHQYEYRYLSQDVKNIVTDSPCFLSSIYSFYHQSPIIGDAILKLCQAYDIDHPCTNIFLHRGDKLYVQAGRFQTYEKAQELDHFMLYMLKSNNPSNLIELDYSDKDGILKAVIDRIDK